MITWAFGTLRWRQTTRPKRRPLHTNRRELMSTKSWLLIQYPHQNTLQLNSANEGYCAHYCRFTDPARHTTRHCYPTNQCSLYSLNLETYYWIWGWQERLSVLSFISLPLVLKKHKCERDKGREKEEKWLWGSKWPAGSGKRKSMQNCVFLHCTQDKGYYSAYCATG